MGWMYRNSNNRSIFNFIINQCRKMDRFIRNKQLIKEEENKEQLVGREVYKIYSEDKKSYIYDDGIYKNYASKGYIGSSISNLYEQNPQLAISIMYKLNKR